MRIFWSFVVVGLASCGRRSDPTPPPVANTTVATAVTAVKTSTSTSTTSAMHDDAAPAMPEAVACAVAYATYPPGFASPPQPGDDLSALTPPMRIPANAQLTISIRKTGHEVTVRGPAVIRPCTRAEPDVVLVALGDVTTEASAPIRPGTELYLANPSNVAIVTRASMHLVVTNAYTTYEVTEGDAVVTTLDTSTPVHAGDKGASKRFGNGGLLLTRCGVQAASVATTERLLAQIGDAGPSPLPAASIGILTAEEVKHARERALDCAFAEAYGLSCDYVNAEGSEKDKASSGCLGGYRSVIDYIAKVTAPSALPPGSPPSKTP